MTDFHTLGFERKLAASPDRVYQALIRAQDRMIWGPPDAGSVVIIENQPDPAPGVRETARCGPADNPYVTVTTDWILMQPAERLVYAETLDTEGHPLGISLATFDLGASGPGTALALTVQIANFAGDEMIREFKSGWTHAIDNLTRHMDRQPA